MITIQYGPWLPDVANNPFQMPDQQGPVQVPVADCLNVIYANGAYQSIPSAQAVSGSPTLTFGPVIGAFTFISPGGTPIPLAGTSPTDALYAWNGSSWSLQYSTGALGSPISSSMLSWNIVQFNNKAYAQFAPALFSAIFPFSVQLNLCSVVPNSGILASLVTGSPAGSVLGVISQFLMIGDIVGSTGAQSIGTADGVTVNFSGTSTNAPIYPGSAFVVVGNITTAPAGYDNGNGQIVAVPGASPSCSGTINYQSGAVSVTFSSAPTGGGFAINLWAFPSYRSRLRWSAIGDASSWPTPLTNAAIAAQSGQNDLEYDYGPIMFVSGYPLYGIVFQRNAITRAQYIGGNVVFSWQTYSHNLGLLAKGAAVKVGDNTYFLSDQGFYSTDGAGIYPIGTAQDNSVGIDQWFFSNVNKNALTSISSGYDARLRNVFFAIPTGSNTLPDTLLSYNVIARKWTRSAISAEIVWRDNDGSTDRLGIFDQSHKYSLLTGIPSATAYLESVDMAFSDGMVRDTNGVRPNGGMTSPTVTVGTRMTMQQSVTYNAGYAPDSFGAGFAPALTEGLYTRIRVSDTNATSIHGATCDMTPGGPL